MAYKNTGARVRVRFVKSGSEVLLSANREGFQFLKQLCDELANDTYDQRKPPHFHIEPALNTAEPESVPLELLLTENP